MLTYYTLPLQAFIFANISDYVDYQIQSIANIVYPVQNNHIRSQL